MTEEQADFDELRRKASLINTDPLTQEEIEKAMQEAYDLDNLPFSESSYEKYRNRPAQPLDEDHG